MPVWSKVAFLSGFLLVVLSVLAFFWAIYQIGNQDYLAALVMVAMGVSLLRAGTELVRSFFV